jgi:parallel beta-helix repeat protein
MYSVSTIDRVRAVWVCCLAIGGAALSASAKPDTVFDERCVGTVAELDAALLAAQTTVDNMLIKLKTGTYHVGGSQLRLGGQYLVLRLYGGYNADCSGRAINASNTILDFDNQLLVGPRAGNFEMEGLRITNINGNGFAVNFASDFSSVTLNIRNSEFVGEGLSAQCAEAADAAFAFVANTRLSGSADSGLDLNFSNCGSGGLVQLFNNTVASNSNRGIRIVSNLSDPSKLTLANNIAWGNAAQDVWLASNLSGSAPISATFVQNTYATRLGSEAAGSTGTLGSNPQFINAAGGNFQLQTSSPSINSGSNAFPIGVLDALGQPRVIGTLVDRGAYESAVNDAIAATQVVTNVNDSGAGSLRQAIINANASADFTFIDFNIPGACPQTIGVASALPTIASGARINAFSQPNSVANTRTTGDNANRCVILQANGVVANGLHYNGNTSTQFWLQGLAFSNFGTALRIGGGTNNLVQGNQFGGKVGSITLATNDTDIILENTATATTVGGDSVAQRNVLADANVNGISIEAGTLFSSVNNAIINNLIGTYGVEADDLGTGNHSIFVQTTGNTIRDNVIINGARDAIILQAANNNLIQGNRIGRKDPVCIVSPPICLSTDAGNGWNGIDLRDGSQDNRILDNIVWNGGLGGIFVSDGLRNRISGNSLSKNADGGVTLGSYNGTDNDALLATLGFANRGLNYPAIQSASGGTTVGAIDGTLTTSNGVYRVEIFSSPTPDAAARGEGETYHGGANVTVVGGINGVSNGSANFHIFVGGLFNTTNFTGRYFTATATDASGNTSELSPRIQYQLCNSDSIFSHGFENATGSGCAP